MMKGTIKNRSGEVLDYSFLKSTCDKGKSDWLVVLGHGVTGDKDRPILLDTSSRLGLEGFDTLRFSFSGNGNSGGRFQEATISKEVEDLKAVLTFARKSYSKVCYIGHSMGAAVGVIVASEGNGIDCLISLAGMVDTAAFAKAEFGELEQNSDFMWEEESCPLSSTFMSDLCEHVGSVISFAGNVFQPWLLVHGTADDVVPMRDTKAVKVLRNGEVSTVFINGANHSFTESKHKDQLLSEVSGWIVDVTSS